MGWIVCFLQSGKELKTPAFKSRADAIRDACGKWQNNTDVKYIEEPDGKKVWFDDIKKECASLASKDRR